MSKAPRRLRKSRFFLGERDNPQFNFGSRMNNFIRQGTMVFEDNKKLIDYI